MDETTEKLVGTEGNKNKEGAANLPVENEELLDYEEEERDDSNKSNSAQTVEEGQISENSVGGSSVHSKTPSTVSESENEIVITPKKAKKQKYTKSSKICKPSKKKRKQRVSSSSSESESTSQSDSDSSSARGGKKLKCKRKAKSRKQEKHRSRKRVRSETPSSDSEAALDHLTPK